MEDVPPPDSNAAVAADRAYEQAAPDCVTVNVCPAMTRRALLAEGVMFGATVKRAEPLPEPEPLSTVIHESPTDVVHGQPLSDATPTESAPPAESTDAAVLDNEYVQPTPA